MSKRTINESQGAPKTKRWSKGGRRLIIGLLVFLALGAFGSGLVIQNRLEIASWGFREVMGTLGLTDIKGQVSDLNLGRVVLDDVRIGPSEGMRLKRLEITYGFFDLLGGRVRQVTLIQPDITAVLGPNDRVTTDFDGLFIPENGANTQNDTVPPLDLLQRLVIDGGRLRLMSPEGDLLAEALVSLEADVVTVDPKATALVLQAGSVHLVMPETAKIKGTGLNTPLDLRLAGPGRMVFDLADKALERTDITLALDGPLEVGTAALGDVRASGLSLEITKSDSSDPFKARLQVDQLEMLDVRARTLDLLVENTPDGPTARITFQVDRLPGEATVRTPIGGPRPLNLTMAAHPTPDGYRGEGTLTAGQDGFSVAIKGEITAGGSRGRIDLVAPPATFSSVLTPGDFHVLAGDLLTLTSGKIAIQGTIGWDHGPLVPDLKVMLQDATGQIGTYDLQGLSTVLTITQFSPLKSTVAEAGIGLLDPGVPLTNGLAKYRFDGNGHIRIESLKFAFADGQVRSSAPLVIPLSGGRIKGTFLLENLSLKALGDLTGLEELSASGQMTGRMSVVLTTGNGAILIDQASLQSVGEGEIRYITSGAAAAAGGSDQASVHLLMKAIEDFHFETFNITLTGNLRQNLTLGVFLKGSNPALYDGYPIELNVNIDGAFLDLITRNVHTYQIPDRIRENLNDFLNALPQQADPKK